VSAAALLWSTGGLIVRSLELADAWTTVLWGGLAAGTFLLAFIALRERRNTARAFLGIGWPGIVAALCYGNVRDCKPNSRCRVLGRAIIMYHPAHKRVHRL
jgi:hypothetical protein